MQKQTKIPKYLTLSIVVLLTITSFISNGIFAFNPIFNSTPDSVSALTYQSNVDLQFTINPSVNISIAGGDLSIASLTPGGYADSNIVTITASSNNADGYTLYATVGSSSNNSTELRKDGTSTTSKFDSISSNISSLSNFSSSSNTWGYSYSTDSGSTWVSGSQGSTASGYNGLPLYSSNNTAAGVILADTPSASESNIQFKIGARATSTQVSGSYTNVINFIGISKVITRNYTIAYNANSGTGAPSSASGTVTSTNPIVTLSTTIPTREGYTFKGWCDVSTSDDTCSGTTTQPGHIYAVNTTATSNITVTMYAMWERATPTIIEFTISGTTYQAEDGMTWSEWVESEYNTSSNIVIVGDHISMGVRYMIYKDSVDQNSCSSDINTGSIIISGGSYQIFNQSACN